jgi:hypothetical protein
VQLLLAGISVERCYMTASVMMEQAFGVPTFQDAGLPVPQKVNADELSLVEAKAGQCDIAILSRKATNNVHPVLIEVLQFIH